MLFDALAQNGTIQELHLGQSDIYLNVKALRDVIEAFFFTPVPPIFPHMRTLSLGNSRFDGFGMPESVRQEMVERLQTGQPH